MGCMYDVEMTRSKDVDWRFASEWCEVPHQGTWTARIPEGNEEPGFED